jgi:probable F420-dependent oxidoreductase
VAGVDFRNPVVFAKECATIDLLSEGRFTLGIGAGWSNKDYAIAGIRQDDASTRIERLGEAVTIMKGPGEGPFSFSGSHYEVAEVDAGPSPTPPIPVMIGGGGPKILAMAAQQADIVGINPKIVGRRSTPPMATTAADTMDEKVAWVKEAAGDRFDDLELQLQVFVTVVTDDPQAAAEKLGTAFGLPPEVVLARPSTRSVPWSRSRTTSWPSVSAGGSATSCSSLTAWCRSRRWWPSSAAPEPARSDSGGPPSPGPRGGGEHRLGAWGRGSAP